MADITEKVKQAGHQLKVARLNAGLTLEDIERKTGLNSADTSRMETGRTGSPSLDKSVRYAAAIGISPNRLAKLYGLWYGADEEEDPKLTRLLSLARELSDSDKDRLIDMVEVLSRHSQEKVS